MDHLSRIVEQLESAGVDELDAALDGCLQLLGLELELTIASLVHRDGDRLSTRREWRANGYMDPAFELELSRAHWWSDHLTENEDVVIDDVRELPAGAVEERDYLGERSTASLVAIATGWRSDDFLVAEVLWQSRPWSAEALGMLAGAARHFGIALARQAEKRELQAAAERAAADNAAKSAFIATLAHELRTPLTAILGYAQLLRSDAAEPLQPKQRQFLGDILSCAEHLDRIVEESLALAKLDSNQMPLDLAELDLCEVVRTAAASVEPRARDAKLELTLEMPEGGVPITGDALKLSQILINLMSNAIKFTPKGSIRVSLTSSENEVVIAVRDTGMGIAAGNLERIFDSFARVHRRTGAEGTGLGLALVKRMVELHEGRIEVESKPGEGSCFSVTLPRRPLGSEAGRTAYVRSVV